MCYFDCIDRLRIDDYRCKLFIWYLLRLAKERRVNQSEVGTHGKRQRGQIECGRSSNSRSKVAGRRSKAHLAPPDGFLQLQISLLSRHGQFPSDTRAMRHPGNSFHVK